MIDARHEFPIAYTAAGEDIFGIVTSPPRPHGIGVVLLSGGDFIPSTNRNRLYVRMARRLAAAGYHVLRFDYHGVGESTGDIQGYSSDRPFVHDVSGAVAWFERAGISEVVLVGNCFGSRTALAAAERVAGLKAIVLISSPVRDFRSGERVPTRLARDGGMPAYLLRGMRLDVFRRSLLGRYRRRYISIIKTWAREKIRLARGDGKPDGGEPQAEWVSERLVQQMAGVVRRRIPTLVVYGAEEDLYDEFTRARAGRLGTTIDRAGPLVEVRTLEGTVHGFPTLAVQQTVLDLVEEWIWRAVPGKGTPSLRAGAAGRP
ncbi:MAG: alpha/beta hydrolase [Armatimonadetes bacterium CSP1-3]|nr:MAG: alpha/beta hydrolase [Armatimonadetes bacterium CSP1-3]